jgi:4-carboxymuconolactone decarboxylase
MTVDNPDATAGLELMTKVFGPAPGEMLAEATDPLARETIEHLFGKIWSRPGLSVRDRRLLIIGVTAALGRRDLIAIQVRGAIENGELDDEQLDEIPLHLAFYVGWGSAGEVYKGVEDARRAGGG